MTPIPEAEVLDWVARGDLVLPDRVLEGGSLGVRGEKIAAIFEAGQAPPPSPGRDYSGRLILPGLVDTHVHAGSFVDEDIASTTASAAAGGVTTIVDMPYDREAPVMDAERLREKIKMVGEQARVDVGLYGTMAKVGGLDALEELVEGGVCAFKFSLFEYDPNRFPRIPDGDLYEAFELLSASGVPIVLHNELQEVIESRLKRVLDTPAESNPHAHSRSRPPVSETAASAKALDFAYWSGARLHLAHCTHPHTFRLIDYYRGLGAAVSGETCAHYLMLTEADVAELGAIAKVNPPIRDAESLEALWQLLREGKIATVSTDHAPWPIETKQGSVLRASAGAPGLESFLGVVYTAGSRRGFPLAELIGYLTWRPAEIFGVGNHKGKLELGFDADLAVFDAREPQTFRAADSLSSAKWSPFDGFELDGRVEATFVRGEQAFADGRVLAEPGSGRWLSREAD